MKYFLALFALVFIACNKPEEKAPIKEEAKSENVISFKGRSIDLEPYFTGFPYKGFNISLENDNIYYYQVGDVISLMELPRAEKDDLSKGKKISNIDFAKRNVWGMKYNKTDGMMYWSGDEKNDEIINLFKMDPKVGEAVKLTDVPYIYGWGFNEAKTKAYYVPRLGHIEDRLGELRILDLASGEEKTVFTDTPEFRLTWGSPSISKDEKIVIYPAMKNADRTYANLLMINTETGESKVITDPAIPRSYPLYALSEWIDDNTFMYYSNESGFHNVWSYNIKTGKNTQLTNFDVDVKGVDVVENGDEKVLFCITSNPIQSNLYIVDFTGKVIHQEAYAENLGVIDVKGNEMIVSSSSAVNKFSIDKMTINFGKTISFTTEPFIGLPAELKNSIVNASIEAHTYPTFDKDENTGEQRMLHGFLYTPENPLPKEDAMVIIQSFYGGNNSYSHREHIFADAGIYFFSPSPRGSSGFGREFAAMNDKDLGGDEIIDVIYAAKYISEKLGIPAERIGVWGRSHGGYATMRLMTFPGEINGNTANFDWGFGMSDAGFSDIIHFYENCNIPDWVTLEAGDPKTEADKINDRSPRFHADKAMGPILLTHGTNDSRVPKEGSIWFADSLKAHGKDVTLSLYEGEGHSVKGLAGFMKLYKTRFEFFENYKK